MKHVIVARISLVSFLIYGQGLGTTLRHAHGFTMEPLPTTTRSRSMPRLFQSSTSTSSTVSPASSSSALSEQVDVVQNQQQQQQQPITPVIPRDFEWWDTACDRYLDTLEDDRGGERFVASHDEPEEERTSGTTTAPPTTRTQNWLHVTASCPNHRVQYELRYLAATRTLGGVIRFGQDCEGPVGCAHGGAIATVADALVATCGYQAAQHRWGMTTRLECHYRSAIPLNCPVQIEATVLTLKRRTATVEWTIRSLMTTHRKEENRNGDDDSIRYAFGSADLLLPRLPKQ